MNVLNYIPDNLLPKSMALYHKPPYMTSSLVPEQHVFNYRVWKLLLVNIPGVHLHNCWVHFVKQTVKQLLFSALVANCGRDHTSWHSLTVSYDVEEPLSWEELPLSWLDVMGFEVPSLDITKKSCKTFWHSLDLDFSSSFPFSWSLTFSSVNENPLCFFSEYCVTAEYPIWAMLMSVLHNLYVAVKYSF